MTSTRIRSLALPNPVARAVRIAFAAAAACAAQGAAAQTPPPPGVGIYLDNSVSGTNNYVGNGSATYATGPGISIYSGGGLHVDGQPFYALTSAPLPAGLTTGTLSSIGSSGVNGGPVGEVTSTGDLAGGVLRVNVLGANTSGLYNPVGPTTARGIASAQLRDNLTFQVLGGGVADITVTAHLDGFFALDDPAYASASQAMTLGIGGAAFSELGGESDVNGFSSYQGHNSASGYVPPYGWVSYSFSNETPAGFDFVGVFQVSDGQRSALSLGLTTDCWGATCGFAHTGSIGLVLPDHVRFTSDSGVFLSAVNAVAPVPEPETWALMLAGLAVLGRIAKRRPRS